MERGTPSAANDGTRLERARQRAQESNTGLLMFMVIGRYMVELAARNEPDPYVRHAKRNQLLSEWTRYTGHVAARAA